MTRNLYQPWSYWALTHLLISGLIWSWGPQTGELMCCLLNLKFFFHSRSCLHQAVRPATLLLLKSSKWPLLSGPGPVFSLGTMILAHRGLFANVSCLEHPNWGPSLNHSGGVLLPPAPTWSRITWVLRWPGYRKVWRTKDNVPWQTKPEKNRTLFRLSLNQLRLWLIIFCHKFLSILLK